MRPEGFHHKGTTAQRTRWTNKCCEDLWCSSCRGVSVFHRAMRRSPDALCAGLPTRCARVSRPRTLTDRAVRGSPDQCCLHLRCARVSRPRTLAARDSAGGFDERGGVCAALAGWKARPTRDILPCVGQLAALGAGLLTSRCARVSRPRTLRPKASRFRKPGDQRIRRIRRPSLSALAT